MKVLILTVCLLASLIHGSTAQGGGIPPFCVEVCNNCDDPTYPVAQCLADIDAAPGNSCHACNPSIGNSCGAAAACPAPLVCDYVGFCYPPSGNQGQGIPPFCQVVCDNCDDPNYPLDQCYADIAAQPGNSCHACYPRFGTECSTAYNDCPSPLVCTYSTAGDCVSPCDCTGIVCITCTPADQAADCECCPICPEDECDNDYDCEEFETCNMLGNCECVDCQTVNCSNMCYPYIAGECNCCPCQCSTDNECAENEQCVNGFCECVDCLTVDCNNMCYAYVAGECNCCQCECTTDEDCNADETCQNGVCAPICDLDCTGVACYACQYGSQTVPCSCCPQCLQPPGGEGTPCSDDSMCAYGFHCYMHVSFDGCDIDGVCVSDGTPTGVCGNCDSNSCWQVSDCYFGIEWDYCGCCQVCCMGPGEHCGGPNNIYGICGVGFHCVPYDNSWDGYGYCDC